MVALGSCNLWLGEFQVNSCHGQDAISVLRKNEDLILVSLPFPGFTDRKLRQRPTTRLFAKRVWFFVNSCGLSYLGEANSKVELWPSKRISRSWRHHLPTSLQSSRHGKRCIGDGNQNMCFFQASSKDVPRGRATLLDIQRYRQLPPRNHVNEHRCGGQLVRGHWPFILCSARDGRVTTGDKISLLEEKYWRALERSFLSSSYFCSCFLFFFVPFREAMSISAVPGQKKVAGGCRCCPWRELSSSWGLWDRAVAWEHGKLPWSVGTLAKPRSESWVTFRIFRCATLESWEVGICRWGVICNSEQLQQVGMMVAGCLGGFVVLLWLQPWWKNSQRVHFEGRNFKLPALLAGEFDKLETHLVTTCAHDKCEAGHRKWSAFCGFSLMEPDTPQLSFMMKRQAWPCQTEGRCRTLRNKG